MPFDPNTPQPGTLMDANQVRANFVALKDLIDAVPAGSPGPAGSDGQPGADGSPGSNGTDGRGIAEVYDSGDGRAMVRMSDDTIYGPFSIASGPQGGTGSAGADGRSVTNIRDNGSGSFIVDMSDGASYGPFTPPPGATGERGSDGMNGANGNDGPPGPEGRSVVNVRDSGDGRAIVDMSDGSSYGPFTVASGPAGPQGSNGSDGSQGPAGNDGRGIAEVYDSGDGRAMVRLTDGSTYGPFTVAGGPQGPQGQPGEVSNQQLNDAIGGTSANTNAVELLASDADQATIIAKINEMLTAQRR